MHYASLFVMIAKAAAAALDLRTNKRDVSATPKNPTPAGRGSRWSVATDRRMAKKARNVRRNRAAHRG